MNWWPIYDQISGCSENNDCKEETELPVLIALQFPFTGRISTEWVQPFLCCSSPPGHFGGHSVGGQLVLSAEAFRRGSGCRVGRAGEITMLCLWCWAACMLWLKPYGHFCVSCDGFRLWCGGKRERFLSDLSKNTLKNFTKLVLRTNSLQSWDDWIKDV